MELSPNDIRGYKFRSQMRGYDREEVDRFLEQIAAALEGVKQQNMRVSIEMESLRSQLSGLKQFEDTIKSAAIDARRNADMTVATAKQEAAMLISRAKSEAENIVVNRTKEIGEIESQITRLGLTRKSYLSKIKNLVQSHLQMIDEIDSGEMPREAPREVPENRIMVTESKDVTTETRETVALQPAPAFQETEAESESEPESEPEPETVEEPSVESQASPDNLAAELKQAIQAPDLSPSAPPPIDPELAAALESYKRIAARKAAEHQAATQQRPALPRQDEVIETNRLAEEIPEGFVAKETDIEDNGSTDKVLLSQTSRKLKPGETGGFKRPISPEELAGELDEVAVRFEEEINKATKS
jgi:cell division initiation protein